MDHSFRRSSVFYIGVLSFILILGGSQFIYCDNLVPKERYTGTDEQNAKLFKIRPELRRTTFSTRMLAWEQEFGKKKNYMGKASWESFDPPL